MRYVLIKSDASAATGFCQSKVYRASHFRHMLEVCTNGADWYSEVINYDSPLHVYAVRLLHDGDEKAVIGFSRWLNRANPHSWTVRLEDGDFTLVHQQLADDRFCAVLDHVAPTHKKRMECRYSTQWDLQYPQLAGARYWLAEATIRARDYWERQRGKKSYIWNCWDATYEQRNVVGDMA